MKKVKVIGLEQLVAGLILKFGKVYGVDLTLLLHGIRDIVEIAGSDIENLEKYIFLTNGDVLVVDSYVDKLYKRINNSLMERIQGEVVKQYLEELDIEEYTLRKIKFIGEGNVSKEDLRYDFSISQIYAMIGLYQKGYIMDYWEEENVYDDYKAIKLTKRGELKLFLRDNEKEVLNFSNLLKNKGYDNELITSFLITQDLEKRAIDILTIECFLDFCGEFDICPYVSRKENGRSRTLSQKKN